MRAWLFGMLGAWATLRLFGADRPWPWRLGDLDPTADRPADRRSDRQREPRREQPPRRRPGRHAASLGTASVVDLLGVAVTAGHGLRHAIAVVGDTARGPLADELGALSGRVERGAELRAELMRLPDALGDPVRPLAVTLCAALGSGAPLAPQLQRLADAERTRERHRREARVRRLPVLLLGPLVGLILPAFVLLCVAPVALGTFGDLSTDFPHTRLSAADAAVADPPRSPP